jgi:hypothetical protein
LCSISSTACHSQPTYLRVHLPAKIVVLRTHFGHEGGEMLERASHRQSVPRSSSLTDPLQSLLLTRLVRNWVHSVMRSHWLKAPCAHA